MKQKVAVVILNWNGKDFLAKFMPSLIQFSPEAEIIVADNLSSDDSMEFMQEHYPQIRTIQNGENGGYAKGYNMALSEIDATYYVLVNSDIEVTEGWLQPLIDFADQHPEAGALQPKIRAFHEKEKFEYAGAAGGYLDRFGYPFCRGRLFESLETDQGQYDDIKEVFWATGACMFVKAEAFHQVGGLDDDFFAHMEEIDLCWRLQHQGYKNFVIPQSLVYHVGGGTLPKNSPFKTYLNFRNNLLLLHKNMKPSQFGIIFFLRLVLDGVAGLKFLLSGQAKDTRAVIKAHFHFYARMRSNRKKRPSTYANLKLYPKSIVYKHYIKRLSRYSDLP